MKHQLIDVRKVSKKYKGNVYALKNINFSVKQGEFVYVIGASGAGKSTLLKFLYREEEQTFGSIKIGNTLVSRINHKQLYLLRRKLGVVMQKDLFLSDRTVFENIAVSIEAVSAAKSNEIALRTNDVLEVVGMVGMNDRKINELSIGQQKRVAIARAIVNYPTIVIADEPTANLDAKAALEIMKLFFKINSMGTTIIMATHDSTMVNTVRERVLELNHGELIRDEQEGGYTRYPDNKDVYIW
ncbi:cell division ATP-binding protein FtsE [Liquorilactobacillus cacaonum DSM 21116]|uniref:Cell division ATP-binding protein FtsE n=1 Tax=Liquorilactobacillus cacaonum DSM 21116 TaxID=1423729 RepID=A0A0R2CKM8_9LACO|nr:cell division ATP-binding protein FtsE [Liquorilactobacillus cacaonum DSM 21116]